MEGSVKVEGGASSGRPTALHPKETCAYSSSATAIVSLIAPLVLLEY